MLLPFHDAFALQEDMDDMLAHNDEDLGGEELGTGNAAAHYRDLDMRRQGGQREQTEEEMAKYIEEKYKWVFGGPCVVGAASWGSTMRACWVWSVAATVRGDAQGCSSSSNS